ncbi:CRP-like cAMP-binding protein [Aquimarina sp. MAR_2010_214]|uniref:Crp/Fnr family transcriptional regulator n=1 Tax=Aquimarina sp. MAR_2010_214 TaxID=1250026 RepID=UPI000C7047C1|nr:cyclic nucleotide-binding domain-containing protein [Aquimarina sp. MAR_2010_214]PKV51265.1 CRP-like cAMP-binding protein [Aquimarina sp. MAR_2010_214]
MKAIQELKNNLKQKGILAKSRVLDKDEYLDTFSGINTNLYFITKGSLRVFFTNDNEEHILYFGYKGSLITTIDSFFSTKVSQLKIQALKKTEVNFISKNEFMEFITSNPENLDLWQAIQGELIHLQAEREIDLLISSPVKRYQRVLKRRPQLFQEIPHKYIASYLRMAPETLSRIKKS